MLQHFIPDLQLGEIEPLLESTLIRQIKMVDYRLNDLGRLKYYVFVYTYIIKM